jgi:ATP-dependent DNA ligase
VAEQADNVRVNDRIPFAVPPPLALTRPTDAIRPAGMRSPVWEPKWDGWRAVWADGGLWSRHGKDLSRYFPDLLRVLGPRLPRDLVIDAEIVCWNPDVGRLDFNALARRLTAGRRLANAVAHRPAHLVCFDLLAISGQDTRPLHLHDRRSLLERELLGMAPPITLCQQTHDEAVARRWFETLSAGGIEGVIIKDARGRYPEKEGQRIWHKLKVRDSLDLAVMGVFGNPAAPSALLLAAPGRDGALRAVGTSTVLTGATSRAIGLLLRPTGETVLHRAGLPRSDEPLREVKLVEPIVVEVSSDVAMDHGKFRHPVRFIRVRVDLTVADVELP